MLGLVNMILSDAQDWIGGLTPFMLLKLTISRGSRRPPRYHVRCDQGAWQGWMPHNLKLLASAGIDFMRLVV